jgi:hypothetical protein
MLLLLMLAKNKQYFPALPKTAPAKNKQEAITKYSRSAQHFTLFSPSEPLLPLKKESIGGLDTASWDSTVLLTLALTLTLTLASAFLSSKMPPDTVLSGSMAVLAHSALRGKSREIFFRLISIPVHCSDLSMAKSRLPHSGDSHASRVATPFALAFDLEPRSSLHAFHTSRPCVTCVSIPLVLTRTSPAVVDLAVCAVGMSALLNIYSLTGFLAPLLPSQLW